MLTDMQVTNPFRQSYPIACTYWSMPGSYVINLRNHVMRDHFFTCSLLMLSCTTNYVDMQLFILTC